MTGCLRGRRALLQRPQETRRPPWSVRREHEQWPTASPHPRNQLSAVSHRADQTDYSGWQDPPARVWAKGLLLDREAAAPAATTSSVWADGVFDSTRAASYHPLLAHHGGGTAVAILAARYRIISIVCRLSSTCATLRGATARRPLTLILRELPQTAGRSSSRRNIGTCPVPAGGTEELQHRVMKLAPLSLGYAPTAWWEVNQAMDIFFAGNIWPNSAVRSDGIGTQCAAQGGLCRRPEGRVPRRVPAPARKRLAPLVARRIGWDCYRHCKRPRSAQCR